MAAVASRVEPIGKLGSTTPWPPTRAPLRGTAPWFRRVSTNGSQSAGRIDQALFGQGSSQAALTRGFAEDEVVVRRYMRGMGGVMIMGNMKEA